MSLPPNQQVVRLNTAILRHYGMATSKHSRILDYGCGSGRHTYEYLDEGFDNVVGFDVEDYVKLRNKRDRSRFSFLKKGEPFRIPFPDNHFDLVTSTSVFEHVANLTESVREIARVLKPDGATLHVFPSRWRPIEPHIFVPFGGAIQASWWLAVWARLGVRNEFQRGLSARETASRNLEYCATGIHYPPFEKIDASWQAQFQRVEYAERAYIAESKRFSKVSRIADRCIGIVPSLINLYRFCHFRVIFANEPNKRSQYVL